jgi:hypothetical protein
LTDLIWSFSPWFVFLFASRFTSFSGAVALGFLTSVVVLTRATTRHRAHMLDWAGLCYFAALALILAITHPGHIETWSRYAQFGSHMVLTILVFGSVLVGRPFTESYAKMTTPQEVWHTKEFRDVNPTSRSTDVQFRIPPSPRLDCRRCGRGSAVVQRTAASLLVAIRRADVSCGGQRR